MGLIKIAKFLLNTYIAIVYKDIKNPHDRFFKSTMTDLEIAKDYMRNFLPPEVVEKLQLEQLSLETTNYISDELAECFSDIVYNCPYGKDGQEVQISLLLEHKSYVSPYPHYQLLRYMLSIWDYCIANNLPLKIVIPIIFYHGKDTWKVKPFSDYFEGIDETLRRYIPLFMYELTDVNTYTDDVILALNVRFLRNALLLFKYGRNQEFVAENFELFFVTRKEEDTWNPRIRNFFHKAFVYLILISNFGKREVNKIIQKLPSRIKQIGMSTYEQLIEAGKIEGLEKGEQIGLEKAEQIRLKKEAAAICRLYQKGSPIQFIADVLDLEESYVREVLKKYKLLK